MSLATSMKSLVEDIRASTKDRHVFVGEMKKDTKELIARFAKELKEMAKDLKDFLAHSEKARKEDFAVVMKDIAERLGVISKWQKDVRKWQKDVRKEYAADQKKAREYWLSLSAHEKPAHAHKEHKEED